jgi:carboxyl-terminal processing protease
MKYTKKILLVTLLFVGLLQVPTYSIGAGDGADFDRKRNSLIGFILSKQLPALHFSDKELDDQLAEAAFDLYIKQLDYQKRFLLKEDIQVLQSFAKSIDNSLANGKITLPDAGYDILNERIDQVQKMVEEMLRDDSVVGFAPEGIAPVRPAGTIYTVVKGDTLTKIASKFNGIEVRDLTTDNDLSPETRLALGQELKIRQFGSSSPGLSVGAFKVTDEEAYESDPEKITFAADSLELKDRWRQILKLQLISQYLDMEAESEQKELKNGEVQKEIEPKSDADLWLESVVKLRKRNSNFFHRLRQETLQDHYDRFFNSVTRAFGPHTNYIPPASKEQFDINMRGSLEGIGALLREDDGFIKVVRIIPGSASARQGMLKAEDIIMAVAQEGEEPVDITEMRLRDAVRLIRGPKGEAVTLTVKNADGGKETIRIVRDVVQIEETFVKSTVLDSIDGRKIGYIFIPSFYRDFEGSKNGGKARNSTDDTRVAIQKLKEQFVDGMILDLRDDGGGALIDAVDITGLFIESGPVVQVKNSFGDERILSDKNDSVYYDGPLVVLVNKFSASASEILAAALQDYGRAIIVGGKHTHGKGTVQTIIDLNKNIPLLHLKKYEDLGALKVMIQKFYRVNGSSTQYKGVEPDIVLPNLFEHIKSGERYLDYSLPWDSIDPVEFEKWAGNQFDLPRISAKSLARAAEDEGLTIIREEAEKAAVKSENTIVAIQLADMRAKRSESKLMRQKVGAHYRKYRDEQEGEFATEDSSAGDDEDLTKKWLKEVNEDPYIREAANIIGDLLDF